MPEVGISLETSCAKNYGRRSDLRDIAQREPDEMGRLHPGRRIIGTAGPDAVVEVILTRIEAGRVMASVLDATPYVTSSALTTEVAADA